MLYLLVRFFFFYPSAVRIESTSRILLFWGLFIVIVEAKNN